RKRAKERHPELRDDEIGVCFISPCPAKASYVKNGFADYESKVDVVVSMSDVYFSLISKMSREGDVDSMTESGMVGIGWASSGGEATALFNDEYLAADGVENVINVLEQMENGNMPPVKFVELDACTAGCVGGVLTVQNPYIAKTKLQSLRRYMPVSRNILTPEEQEYIPEMYLFNELPEYKPIAQLSNNMAESMRMMADIQKLHAMLPGIDCGACGAPSCRALAEDIVRGNATLEDCMILDRRGDKK
ncbi:MAG: (Fe-S)-binding protein, partial [Atopobiaceae bacterium]|nr:(Fe-S)-binding protein [Atopobiaceae bacterium]